jgi:hypothetical protein
MTWNYGPIIPKKLGGLCKPTHYSRVTPAMAAGTSDHVWDIEEIVSLLG